MASLRGMLKKLDDDLNISEGGQRIERNTSQFFENPLDWFSSTFVPGPFDKMTNDFFYGTGLVDTDTPPPGAPPDAPDLDAARRNAQTVKRRGRAASILSERPAGPLSYTGGGVGGANILLGA